MRFNPLRHKFMSDEIPPAPSESTEDATKAETIRITLPPKPEQPTAKRETVRINLPGKPATTNSPVGAPKKETTKIATAEAPTQPPPPAGKPFVPPPPKPPGSLGGGPLKPVSGINPPPKPPSLGGAKPTVPLKPAAPPSSVAKPVRSRRPAASVSRSRRRLRLRRTRPPGLLYHRKAANPRCPKQPSRWSRPSHS